MIKLERFERSHLKQLKVWGLHEDPRFQHYDFKGFNNQDYYRWFINKQGWLNKRLFAILNDCELVGFLTMKSINWLLRRAEMGIVINPDKLSRGYGTVAVRQFLSLFFNQYHFNEIYLKVADFNQRAMRSYMNNGFTIKQTHVEPYEIQSNPFAIIMADKDSFFMRDGRVMTTVHQMTLNRADYNDTNER